MTQLERTARETLAICERGGYLAASGQEIRIDEALRAAIAGTRVLSPGDLAALTPARKTRAVVEIADETTQIAAQRLARAGDVVLLNFASARNAGGGFLGGAKAQEEDLCRCSGLYPCLAEQHQYYAANRAERSLLYTDHAIYSPRVPFFRTRGKDAPIEEPFLASVITAPAPNGVALERDPSLAPALRETFVRRAGYVLRIAEAFSHRTIVLGAWGCGAFRNDPTMVAEAFAEVLADADVDRVVFAIPRAVERNHEAFTRRFG